tara:strand:+ start:4783 stop:5556 length:774 start_codon:yes stop_codon:yes gene_type:complete
MKYFTIFLLFITLSLGNNDEKKYSLRKYQHVKVFYSGIAKKATKICLDNNIPPASLLAVAGLESGWNQGYIGKISGNILSLNINQKSRQLPPLYLPTLLKENRVLFDSLELKKYKASELKWKKRPESFKKDYRPLPWRGTTYNLGYFKNHPTEKNKAHLTNITDFVTTFIGRKSGIKAYRDARKKMDSLVKIHGKKILLEEKTAIDFINAIGGKPNSYNFRETWPKKVIYIIKRAGLVDLTKQLNKGDSFKIAWEKK